MLQVSKSDILKRVSSDIYAFHQMSECRILDRNQDRPKRSTIATPVSPGVSSSFSVHLPPIERSKLKQELSILRDSPEKNYSSNLNSLLNRITPIEMPTAEAKPTQNAKLILAPLTERKGSRQFAQSPYSPTSPKETQKMIKFKTNTITKAGFKTQNYAKNKIKSFTVIKPSLKNLKGNYLFALGEGHGPYGSSLAQALKQEYSSLFESNLEPNFTGMSIFSLLSLIDQRTLDFLRFQNQELHFSAVSLFTVVVSSRTLMCSNIGVCGTVIAKFSENWSFVELSSKHDLDNKQELSRFKNSESKLVKDANGHKKLVFKERGLEIEQTRALGFLAAGPAGVLNSGHVDELELGPEDKFVLMASSSVWALMSYHEAVELCIEGYLAKKTELCCEAVSRECEKRRGNCGKTVDDISVLVFFINLD